MACSGCAGGGGQSCAPPADVGSALLMFVLSFERNSTWPGKSPEGHAHPDISRNDVTAVLTSSTGIAPPSWSANTLKQVGTRFPTPDTIPSHARAGGKRLERAMDLLVALNNIANSRLHS